MAYTSTVRTFLFLSVSLSFLSLKAFAVKPFALQNLFLILPTLQTSAGNLPLVTFSKGSNPLSFFELSQNTIDPDLTPATFSVLFKSSIRYDSMRLDFNGRKLSFISSFQGGPEVATEIGGVARSLSIHDFIFNGVRGEVTIYEVDFVEDVGLTATPSVVIENGDARVQFVYTFDLSTLQERNLKVARVTQLREKLRLEAPSLRTPRALRRQSPGLQPSIRTFLGPVIEILTEELGNPGEQDNERVRKAGEAFTKQLYQISNGVDALPHRMYERDRLLHNQFAYDRLASLGEVFFYLLEEIEAERRNTSSSPEKVRALAAETLRVVAEIYLIAGKTLGSDESRRMLTTSADFVIAAWLLGMGMILKGSPSAVCLLMGVPFFLDGLRHSIQLPKPMDPFLVFPGVSFLDRILSAKELLSDRLCTYLQSQDLAFVLSPNSDWAQYLKKSETEASPRRLLRLIQVASGMRLSQILPVYDSCFSFLNN